MNPVIAADIADTLRAAINGISLILLAALVPAIIYTVVKTIGVVIQNQKE